MEIQIIPISSVSILNDKWYISHCRYPIFSKKKYRFVEKDTNTEIKTHSNTDK